ncbi:MAG TPA: hypothetical protein DE045_08230 [Oceanospirillaceae bacterium]|nr:hypothetical protein [Oceanospirillaceae bacterium]
MLSPRQVRGGVVDIKVASEFEAKAKFYAKFSLGSSGVLALNGIKSDTLRPLLSHTYLKKPSPCL